MTRRYRDAWDAVKGQYAHLSPQAQAALRDGYLAVGQNIPDPETPPWVDELTHRILRVIDHHPYITATEIAAHIHYSRGHITHALAHLHRQGHVTRHRHRANTAITYTLTRPVRP